MVTDRHVNHCATTIKHATTVHALYMYATLNVQAYMWLGVLLRTPPRTASQDTVRQEREPNHKEKVNCPYAVPPRKSGAGNGQTRICIKQRVWRGGVASANAVHPEVTTSAATVLPHLTRIKLNITLSGANAAGRPRPPPWRRARRVGQPLRPALKRRVHERGGSRGSMALGPTRMVCGPRPDMYGSGPWPGQRTRTRENEAPSGLFKLRPAGR